MPAFRARKRFGQHFLCDQGVIQGIIASIHAGSQEQIVEIGPGLGVLTRSLVQQCHKLDAIEIDRDLSERLQPLQRQYPHFHLHTQDVLTFDLAGLSQITAAEDQSHHALLRVVGNLPYNITTPLLFYLFKQRAVIQDMHFLVQKEVGDRLCAPVNHTNYSKLSVMAQYHCCVETLFDVPPEAFDPPPKVMSSFIRLHWAPDRQIQPTCLSDFEKLVAMAFNQRRKTIQNSLKSVLSVEKIRSCGIDPSIRAQNVSVAEFIALSQCLAL